MNLSSKKYLTDIRFCIERMRIHMREIKTLEDYQSHITVKSAVERELEILGEAMNLLLKTPSSLNITGARKMVALRNRIIHGYDQIDDRIILDIDFHHIPLLESEVNSLLQENESRL